MKNSGRKFTADIEDWVLDVEDGLTTVFQQATNDMLVGIKSGPSITRSGHRKQGTIPRDLGALVGSLQSELYGSTVIVRGGEDEFIFVIAAAEIGDSMVFSWGGVAADYAAHVHYGANGVPGTFWISLAASKWQDYVNAAVKRVKGRLGA